MCVGVLAQHGRHGYVCGSAALAQTALHLVTGSHVACVLYRCSTLTTETQHLR
jgi:hypothetical protein